MSTPQIWNNVIAYVLQVGLLVVIGAALPALLRLRAPRARLLYWQLLLVACLVLPWVRPWHEEVIAATSLQITATQTLAQSATGIPVRSSMPSASELALWLLAAGAAVRLGWLAAGLLKLAKYRRNGREMPLPAEWRGGAGHAKLLLSDEVSGPVTFGFLRPVVLLPASFPSLSEPMQRAILCHELLHVERRDWLFTAGEEIMRAALWFHPAIWWVLGEIQLAREQTVDQAVVEMTQARGPYVDTLLAMAGVMPQADLAPAPLFLRKRHLKQRVMGVMQESGMSGKRLIFVQTAAVTMMAAACWFVTGAFPLAAQPQVVADGLGVSVNLNGSQLMHRSAVVYPSAALAKGVEGTVVVQVKLDANGEVADATVLSGPDELRRGVQQTVLTWHFDKSAALTTRVLNIDFVMPLNVAVMTAAGTREVAVAPAIPAARTAVAVTSSPNSGGQPSSEFNKLEQFYKMQHPATPPIPRRISGIVVTGLPDSARDQLLAQLPVHTGDLWSPEASQRTAEAVRAFDSHLVITANATDGGDWTLSIETPEAHANYFNTRAASVSNSVPAGAVRVGGNVQAALLISQVRPNYPPLAKAARVQGTVKFDATIGKDGTMQDLTVVSGPPLLIQSAMDAVKKWVYSPTLMNGVAVDVVTTIDVSFTLAQDVPAAQ